MSEFPRHPFPGDPLISSRSIPLTRLLSRIVPSPVFGLQGAYTIHLPSRDTEGNWFISPSGRVSWWGSARAWPRLTSAEIIQICELRLPEVNAILPSCDKATPNPL